MDVVTLGAAKADAKKNYPPQWSVISSRPQKMGDASTASTTTGKTFRLSEIAPYAVKSVRLVYANWMNLTSTSAEFPNYNGIRIKSAVHKAGTSAPNRAATDPLFKVKFGGREFGYCEGGGVIITDPIPVSVLAGERWWHESYVDCFLGAGPATPTLSLVAGTGLGVTTYYVVITYVYPDGSESLPSAEASIATTSGNEQFKVTAPAAAPGIIGYRVYFSTTSGGIKYENPVFPMLPLGTDMTITGSGTNNALSRVSRTLGNVGYPVGKGLFDGVGDGNVAGRDYTDGPVTLTGAGDYGGNFGPIAVLGLATDGKLHGSVALLGDSIQAGSGDRGYGGSYGGAGFRALANQTAQIIFDSTKTPKMGFLNLAQGGETYGMFAAEAGGSRRRAVSEYATAILNNYGTNDLGSGSAPLYANELATIKYYAGRKRYFRLTLDPRAGTSTDGYKTVANQTIGSTDVEADRRAFNNCIKGSTGAIAVVGEALFRSAGTAVPTDNLYSGGNGTATKFFTAYPFRQGTETVKVAGVTKTLTTDYTYRGTATINGIAYASGVTFVSAPANGASVTMDYTKIESLGAVSGYTGYFDTTAAVEVNAAGTSGTNGGWWKPARAGVGTTGTATANTSTQLTDTSKSWTVDQWRGMAVRITADSGVPAAVGLVNDIQSNTATTLKIGAAWATTPSATASYEIINPYVIDGTHPTSQGHLEKSLLIDTSLF